MAAQSGDEDAVRLLCPTAEVANTADGSGITPLHAAVIGSQLNIVQLLLDLGADPAQRSGQGRTALHNACARSTAPVVELLLEHGAEMDELSGDGGGTPLDFACDWKRRDIEQLLRGRGARRNGDTPKHAR